LSLPCRIRDTYRPRARGPCDHLAWQILDMASKSTNETANADRVKLAAWQWHAARLSPKRYSEKIISEITGANGGAVQVETKSQINVKALDSDQRETLKSLLLAAKSKGREGKMNEEDHMIKCRRRQKNYQLHR